MEATQTADSRAAKPEDLFFVWKPRRQPTQGPFLFGSHADDRFKSHRQQVFFVQKPHRQPIQGPFVGWKPRRQPIQEPPSPRTCFLFGSHADSRLKDFFCSVGSHADSRFKSHQTRGLVFCLEATQTANSRTVGVNKVDIPFFG